MTQTLATYLDELQAQREQRTRLLLADQGWLTLAGLFWLHEGENEMGSEPTCAIQLPAHSAPACAGVLTLDHGRVYLRAAPGVSLTLKDNVITERELQHDMSGAPDFVTLGHLTLLIIQRGARYGLRLFDTTAPARQNFPGLRWYAIDPALRITANFTPYPSAQRLLITNVLGDTSEQESPGYATFTWQGQNCSLVAEGRGAKLFFNFRDLTNQATTYPAGRFLYTDAPQEGKVTLDFNQATNPFCAYTAFATCPLPPAANKLPVRIEAGEMRYPGKLQG
ncbi:MAG: DUF1684 domain-containing protein [Caldilineaceae bacterium]